MFDFTQVPETEEAKALAELIQIDTFSERALDMFTQQSKMAWERFWKIGVPPEIKIKEAGTNALKMFQVSGAVQAFIKSLRPEHEELTVPPQWNVEFSQDGSCTITPKE